MPLTKELYDQYIRNDFKIILSTGFSSQNRETDEDKRYKAAKKPCEKDWNRKPTKSYEECSEWVNAGGWISAVLPLGTIAVDVDSSAMVMKPDGKSKKVNDEAGLQRKVDQLEYLLDKTKHGLHISNNGRHLLFKMSVDYKSSSSVYTKAGINVTYRCGGMSNIIVAPSNGRRWTRFVDVADLDELPTCLQPLNTDDPDDVRRALATQVRYCYQNTILHGNEDIDMALMGTIVRNLGYTYEQVKQLFEAIYNTEYNESATRANYDRAKNEAEVVQAGTWFKTLSEKKLYDLIALTNMLTKGRTGLTLANGKENITEKMNRYVIDYAGKRKMIYNNQSLYQLKDGFYQPVEDELVEQDFTNFFGLAVQPRNVDSMVKVLKRKFYRKTSQDLNSLLLADGSVLDLTTLKVRPSTPEDTFFFKLPVRYNPDAKCDRWEQFLQEIFPDYIDGIPFLQQYIGGIFLPGVNHELCLMLRGEGANGKSVFMQTIAYVIGEQNVSAISMVQMRNEFHLAKIQNKLLNVSTETESKGLVEDAILKSAISGEELCCNLKFRDPIQFKPFCKFIFSSNNPITTSDRSFGFERRIIFLPFNVDFKKNGKEDTKLKAKLRAEADGIFAWAMRGAKDLIAAGKFKIPACLEDNSQNEHKQGNTVHEFASSYLTWSSEYEAFVTKDLLYAEYKKFCKMNGYMVQNRNNFGRQLKRVIVGNAEQFERRKGTKNVYGNMKLRLVPCDNQGNYIEDLDGGDLAGKSVTECSYEEYLEFERMKI